jgi:cytochrome c peroxidase
MATSRPGRGRRFALPILVVAAAVVAGGVFALLHPERLPEPVASAAADLTGANPHPVHLLRPPQGRLSALALLGRQIFYDPTLSASGRQSCASCHNPEHAYGPPNALPVQLGGPNLTLQGVRPPPSLAYLYRQPPFSIGPDAGELDAPPTLQQVATQARGVGRSAKVAGVAPTGPAIVPQGGLFWDGRSNTLQMQASGPLMDPVEMANTSQAEVAKKLASAKYSAMFKPLFGANILHEPVLLVSEAMSALGRYQVEDPSFHLFNSKYDAWLEGRTRLSTSERRGLKLFDDQAKANCAGCHLSAPGRDGLPPLFTDTQYEALGVPRNTALPANRDPGRFDMGICGPYRTDLANQTQYCGMFLTPTLRNAAKRQVFFHNGVYHSLPQVLKFYNFRTVRSARIYPKAADGKVQIYDDLPLRYHANIDVVDAPFDRKPGQPPAMTDADMADIIAFIRTLNDR